MSDFSTFSDSDQDLTPPSKQDFQDIGPPVPAPGETSAASAILASPKVWVSTFPTNKTVVAKLCKQISLAEFLGLWNGPTYASKDSMPLLKMGKFPDRTSGNVPKNFSAAVGDYDDAVMTLKEAADLLQAAGIACYLFPTASDMVEKKGVTGPRWRVIAPFSKPTNVEGMRKHLAKINHVLGGVLAPESAGEAGCFYYGYIRGATINTKVTNGEYVDTLDLPGTPVGKDKPEATSEAASEPMAVTAIPTPPEDVPVLPDLPQYLLDFLEDGGVEGERSDLMRQLSLELANHFTKDDLFAVMWAQDGVRAYLKSKRKTEARQKAYLMKEYVTKACNDKGQPMQFDDLSATDQEWDIFGDPVAPVPVPVPVPVKAKAEPWGEPFDLCDKPAPGPAYDMSTNAIPLVYTNAAMAYIKMYDLATLAPYIGLFHVAAAANIRPSVKVEEMPGSGLSRTWYDLNDQAGIVGGSTKGKTKTMFAAIGQRGPLSSWAQAALESAIKKRNDMLAKTPEGKAGEAERKKIKEEFPLPQMLLERATDTSMYDRNAANYMHDVPTNFIVDEWGSVFGGSSYKADGNDAATGFWRHAYNNEPHTSTSKTGANTYNERVAANLVFNCANKDMGMWAGYSQALGNGTLARISLFAPDTPYAGERTGVLDMEPLQRWEAVLSALPLLRNLHLLLEPDREFDTAVDGAIATYSNIADNGDEITLYMAKARIRTARHAALTYLVEELSQGDNPMEAAKALMARANTDDGCVDGHPMHGLNTLVIPKEYRRRAWNHMGEFIWPHQRFVHEALVAAYKFRGAILALQNRIYCNGLTEVSRNMLVGAAAPQSVRNSELHGEEMIRLLLNQNWIRDKRPERGKPYDTRKPWTAYAFDVNPQCFEMWKLRDAEIRLQHEVSKGKMLARFEVQRDGGGK